MEKMKQLKNQAMNAGQKGRDKSEEIRFQDWAEPTGATLNAAVRVVSVIPPPLGSGLKGAFPTHGRCFLESESHPDRYLPSQKLDKKRI